METYRSKVDPARERQSQKTRSMRLACTLVIVTLIGCNAVSGADGLVTQDAKGAYKATPKSPKTTTSPTKPAGDDDEPDQSQTDDTTSVTDGGANGSGGTTVDSGATPPPPSSTASVACGTTICRDTMPVCCDSAAAGHCAVKGNCAGYFELACDDAGDCASGQVCCVNASAHTATCRTSCPFDASTGQGLICANDGQCPAGEGCNYGATDDSGQFISDSWFFCGPPP